MRKAARGGVGRVPFWGLVREKIPLFALAAGACVAAALVAGIGGDKATPGLPLLERAGNALVSYVVYLWQDDFPGAIGHPLSLSPNGPPPWKVCLAFVVLAGNLRRGCGAPEDAPLAADGLALVSGNVGSGDRDHSNLPGRRPCRPLHLSAGNRSGGGGDMGGGGLERGMETSARDFGRFDGGGHRRIDGVLLFPDYVLERGRNPVEAQPGLHLWQQHRPQ